MPRVTAATARPQHKTRWTSSDGIGPLIKSYTNNPDEAVESINLSRTQGTRK
jgi:hypothetical protein